MKYKLNKNLGLITGLLLLNLADLFFLWKALFAVALNIINESHLGMQSYVMIIPIFLFVLVLNGTFFLLYTIRTLKLKDKKLKLKYKYTQIEKNNGIYIVTTKFILYCICAMCVYDIYAAIVNERLEETLWNVCQITLYLFYMMWVTELRNKSQITNIE